MRILLAIDGSKFSDAAVNEIAQRPWPKNSEVRIISVVEPPLLPTVETWVPPENYIEALEKAGEDAARSVIKKAADSISSKQQDRITITTKAIRGYPKQAILDAAEEWEADLIVVGSHGYRGLTKVWLGSVSQAVSSHAKCSVEIVRNRHLIAT
ncbi:MAG TPA: universal stress protein [Blastocatellia bacterium]|nr:universal stress protein [Blastocatellia bacterium]